MHLKTAITLWSLFVSLLLQAAEPVNVVVDRMTDQYTLIPDESGRNLKRIEQHRAMTFRATKAAANAFATISYNDDKTVNSAKAKGSKPIYGNATSAGIFFDDSRMCILPIKLDAKDKSVEAKFSCTLNRPEHGFIAFVGSNYPVEQYTLSVTMPIDMKNTYDIAATNLPQSATISRTPSADGKNWVITLTANGLPKLELPSDAPSPRAALPLVCLTGMFRDVDDFYSHIRRYIRTNDPDIAEVQEKARQITAQCTTDAQRIAAITHWVNSNIRYIAIEHGELGWEPELASVVLRKRYGDCKGSASLIKSMLNAVNINGRLVWIGTHDIPDNWTDRPMFSTGNHMIAAAMLPGDSIIYLDGTVGTMDFGYYPASIQGKQTLIENGDRCIVHRVPLLPPSQNCDEVTVSYTIGDDGTLYGDFTETISGQYKATLLNMLESTDERHRNRNILGFINEGRKAWAFDNVSLHNGAVDNGPAKITAGVTRSAAIQKAGGNTYLSLDIMPAIIDMLFDMKDRTAPGEIRASRRHLRTVSVQLPDGMTLRELPQSVSIANSALSASLTYTLTDNVVTAQLLMDQTPCVLPYDSLESYNNDIRKLSRAVNNKLVLVNQSSL